MGQPARRAGSKSRSHESDRPGAALTSTCTPAGEVSDGSRASPGERLRVTSGQHSACARAATSVTGSATTASATGRTSPAVPSPRSTSRCASPLRHQVTGLLTCSPGGR